MHNLPLIPTTPLELHRRRQARNLLVVLRVCVGNDTVLPRRDLLRQVHLFGQLRLAVVDRALQVHVLDRVAQVGRLLDDGDEAVLHLQVDVGAALDRGGEVAAGGDGEGFAAGKNAC